MFLDEVTLSIVAILAGIVAKKVAIYANAKSQRIRLELTRIERNGLRIRIREARLVEIPRILALVRRAIPSIRGRLGRPMVLQWSMDSLCASASIVGSMFLTAPRFMMIGLGINRIFAFLTLILW